MALIFSEIVLWHSGSVGSTELRFADKKIMKLRPKNSRNL
jgi:hypothetical protein